MPIRTRDELIESEAIHTLAFTAPSRARYMPLSCQTEPHIGHSAPLYLAHSRAARDRIAPMSNIPHTMHTPKSLHYTSGSSYTPFAHATSRTGSDNSRSIRSWA